MVFELIGPVADFNLAAQALGLEWLRTEGIGDSSIDEEVEEQNQPPDDEVGPPTLLYLTMPSETALRQLLTQWRRYSQGDEPEAAYKSLWRIFDYLHDLRVWSVQDRLDPSVAQYIDAVLRDQADQNVLVEIDLWYRTEQERRDRSVATLRALLDEVGGEMLDIVDIAEIRYQGALVSIPAQVARRMGEGTEDIALLDEVMTIRPQSAYESHIEAEAPEPREIAEAAAPSSRPCLAVLLDGYPVAEHRALAGRVRVVELDVHAQHVPVAARYHGTAMASLVLHGDLQQPDEPTLDRPVAVIPVLAASADGIRESTPPGRLPIGVVYRALRAIVEATPETRPDLASAVVVNHSICDEYAPFVRRPSPWATLLDYFSHQHRLLFLVSAGNVFSSFPLGDYANLAAFQAADPLQRQAALLNAIERSKGTRGILSPAESLNSLTVGAIHADAAPQVTAVAVDPYPTVQMTNLASAVGLGINRSVKPDLIEHGGRFAAACSNVAGGGVEIHPRASPHLGQQVAAPSPTGDLNRVIRTAGTSNAAALATRSCHFIAQAVEEAFAQDGLDWRSRATRAVILKALLVHGSAWGGIGRILDSAYPPQGAMVWARRRDTIARFLGFGRPDRARVVGGAGNRITLLGDDTIRHGELHEYSLPLPASLINTREVRSVTLTLAWTCPTTHTTADYRGISLKICAPDGKAKFWDGVGRTGVHQPNLATAARGTLVHMTLEGKKLVADANGRLAVCVQAMARSSFENQLVPYALAITIEMAQSLRSSLYAEVLQAIRPRVRQNV